jgi:hypothetical protein
MGSQQRGVQSKAEKAVLRIRIGFNTDPVTDPDPAFLVNADPDPGF